MKKHLNVLHPTFKTLALVFFLYGIIISTLLGFSINKDIKALGIIAIVLGALMVVYFIYCAITMVRDFIKARKEVGIIKTVKRGGKMLPFIGTVFSSFINYVFSYVYLIISFEKWHFFYLFISLFYLGALIIKFYILSSLHEDRKKVIVGNFIFASIGVMVLGIFMAIIVLYVVQSQGNFTKSMALIIINIFFATFKAISAIHSFNKHRKKKSYLKLSLSLIAMSFSVFTIFTIHVAFLNYFETSLISLNFTGYPFATIIFAIGILSLIIGIKDYRLISKVEESDETL